MRTDIKALYLEFNAQYFNGECPEDIPVIWNTRLRTTAGYCRYKKHPTVRGKIAVRLIDLNPRLLIDDEKLARILLHEMVHAWLTTKNGKCHKHDYYFQTKMDEIVGYRKSHTYHTYDTSEVEEKRLIEYHCPLHGIVGHRARMPRSYHNYSCRRCGSRITFVDMRPAKTAKARRNKTSVRLSVRLKA